jgi:hypothetical protein
VTVYSELVIAIFSAYLVWRQTGFIPNLIKVSKAIIASLLIGLGLYLVPNNYYYTWSGLLISLVLSSGLYFAILYSLNGITKNDLKILLNKK